MKKTLLSLILGFLSLSAVHAQQTVVIHPPNRGCQAILRMVSILRSMWSRCLSAEFVNGTAELHHCHGFNLRDIELHTFSRITLLKSFCWVCSVPLD